MDGKGQTSLGTQRTQWIGGPTQPLQLVGSNRQTAVHPTTLIRQVRDNRGLDCSTHTLSKIVIIHNKVDLGA